MPEKNRNTSFWLSLVFSHGSGLYNQNEPEKAYPYLISNIVFIDIPLFLMGGSILLSKIKPEVFEGTTLKVVEYITNACLFSVIIGIPIIRYFECKSVLGK